MSSHDPTERNERLVDVVIFGVGTVASAALALCAQRPWLRVAGAIRRPGADAGKAPAGAGWQGIRLWSDLDSMLESTRPRVALMATRSPVDDVVPDIERCVRRGVHVISTSEELAWPEVERPGTAARLDSLAKDHGVLVVATGINPGFIFDALPVSLAAAAWDVESIAVTRILDASVFGRRVHRSLGIGYSAAAFDDAVATRSIRGHIGFAESAQAIADSMGIEIEDFEEELEPVFAETAYELRDYTIEPAETAGVTQKATARALGRTWLRFDLSLHVAPAQVGWETLDRIVVSGANPLDVTVKPGTEAVRTTAARLVNTIPAVLTRSPGFYPATRLLPNPPWLANDSPM